MASINQDTFCEVTPHLDLIRVREQIISHDGHDCSLHASNNMVVIIAAYVKFTITQHTKSNVTSNHRSLHVFYSI